MSKLAWLTDPHLNFAGVRTAEALLTEVRGWDPAAILLTGDLGESHDLEGWLEMFTLLGVPIYFVLGNHDYYGSSIAQVRQDVSALCEVREDLVWLSQADVISLTPNTALVGHDGWGDARVGDPLGTPVMLADFLSIDELKTSGSKPALCEELGRQGDIAAAHLARVLPQALATHAHVVVAAHVPPFEQAAWHEGSGSNKNWSPFFVCKAMGDVLLEQAALHPHRQISMYCGHTHSGGEMWAAPNLRVRTGAATYRKPAWQDPIWLL